MTKIMSNMTFVFLLVIAIGVISAMGFSMFGGGQGFAIFGEQVAIPAYMRAECVTLPEHMNEFQITSHTDKPMWYDCTTAGSAELGKGTYVPIVSGAKCEFTITDFTTASVYECPIDMDEFNKDKCERVDDKFSSMNRISINSGKRAYINTGAIFGSANLHARYPAYGLKVISSTNFGFSTTNSCELTSISRDYHTIDLKDRKEVVPKAPFNVVTEKRVAISSQNVVLAGVEGGRPIYITRPGFYYKIKEADDGFRYVDTAGGELQSDKIECIPRTTGCSDDAEIIQLEAQKCGGGLDLGAITNYAPVEGDNTKLCKYKCGSDKTLSKTNNCIKVQTDCPDDKPLWDASTGKCVEVEVRQEESEDFNFIPIIIIGIFILIIILLFIIKSRQGGSGTL